MKINNLNELNTPCLILDKNLLEKNCSKALLQFFSKRFLSKIKQGVLSSFKLFIFIFNLIIFKIFDFSI